MINFFFRRKIIMSAIKKFFQKRKLDVKFKRAGEGHKLTDDTKSAGGPSSRPQSVQASRSGLSEEAARAAEAALIRTSKTQNKSGEYSLNFEVHSTKLYLIGKTNLDTERYGINYMS